MPRLRLSRGRLLAALLLGVAQPALAASVPSDFQYSVTISRNSEMEGRAAMISLHQGILRQAAPDYSDIRVFDDQQRETPYVIYPATEASLRRDYFALKVLAYRDLPGGCEIVVERPEKRASLEGLQVRTFNRDFQKQVSVESSNDRLHWTSRKTDALFDFTSRINLRKNEIKLPRLTDRYLRVTLRNYAGTSSASDSELRLRYQGMDLSLKNGASQEPFHIQEIEAWSGENEKREAVLEQVTLTPVSVATDSDGNSVITLDAGHLPIRSLTLGVEEKNYFYRRVEVRTSDGTNTRSDSLVGEGWIYNLPGMSKPETSLSLSGSIRTSLQIKIINRDNPPIAIQQIECSWPRLRLFFFPMAGRWYSLYFGAAGLRRPDYDMGRIIPASETDFAHVVPALIDVVRENPGYKPPVPPLLTEQRQRGGLIVLVTVLGMGLGYWAYTLLKKSTS